MSRVFRALSDPTRRQILKLLNEKDMNAGEIAAHFNMSRPAITKHRDILRNAELVSSEKKGQYVIYSINLTVLQETLNNFISFFGKE